MAGARRVPGDADERVLAGELGNRLHEPPRVRMRSREEEIALAADLDDAARIHHRDAIGQRGDDGEIVADVQRRDAVRAAEHAHRLEHVRLRRHVEAGRRLVEHDHARPAREGHRESDALLLSTRQLVRVAAQEAPVGGQQDFGEHLRESFAPFRVAGTEVMRDERLLELRSDPERGVECRRRILRHV